MKEIELDYATNENNVGKTLGYSHLHKIFFVISEGNFSIQQITWAVMVDWVYVFFLFLQL